ncbi:MAG: DUF3822 family protein, partial [Rikenellaceae bacterium]
MLATGNNQIRTNEVSIQISLNGLSFYDNKQNETWRTSSINADQTMLEQLGKLRKLSNKVEITIATDNFVMVPTNIFAEQDTNLYFSTKLLPYNPSLYEYIKTTIKNVTLITAIETDLASVFSNTFSTTTYTSPLQQTLLSALKTNSSNIYVYQSEERCAISMIAHSKLIFSDYIKIASQLDITYYINKLIT